MVTLRQCLLIDSMHPSIFNMLEAMGWHGEDVSEKSIEEIRSLISGYEGLFVRTRIRVDAKLLGEAPNLKFVARAGAGLDNIDFPFLQQRGIEVVHASEGNRDAVGEYTIGALLSLLRNIPRANAEVRNSIWKREENRGMELMGKTVGIIGYGNMGQAFAKRLSGFGCQVLAYDKYRTLYTDAYAKEASLQEVSEASDIISLHVPLTAETFSMVDDVFLSNLSKSIVLINTARGEIVKIKTIAAGIRSGRIRGAVLDVLENEKLTLLSEEQQEAFTYLKRQENIVFTPHIAGWTFESHVKINEILIQKLQALGF